ncbi:MAG: cellulose biosynthesis protein BcsD [Alphaproteobacteria bacterium]
MTDVQSSLHYYGQRSCAEQWRAFLTELIAEFYDQVDGPAADDFLVRVGARVARALPLPDCTSLADMVAEINRVLWQIDWGWVEIEESGSYLRVVHGAYPIVPMYQNAPDAWFVPVLEGLYTEWLNMLGGVGLRARSSEAPDSPYKPIVLLYGRHV